MSSLLRTSERLRDKSQRLQGKSCTAQGKPRLLTPTPMSRPLRGAGTTVRTFRFGSTQKTTEETTPKTTSDLPYRTPAAPYACSNHLSGDTLEALLSD